VAVVERVVVVVVVVIVVVVVCAAKTSDGALQGRPYRSQGRAPHVRRLGPFAVEGRRGSCGMVRFG
jgi:hypothetical protein